MKSGGDLALEAVRKRLAERFAGVEFKTLMGSVGHAMRHLTPADADGIQGQVDVVVGTTGDCGSCTSWLIHDMVELEKRGIPTTSFVSQTFVDDAHQSAQTFGIADLPLTVVALPFTNQSPDEIASSVDGSLEQVVNGLTVQPSGSALPGAAAPSEWLSFEGADQLAALDAMNRQFLTFGWSDGFPLKPPTPTALEEMITGANRDADDIVGIMEPGFGIATVRKVAANAVMAGCLPEHMPIIIAALEALMDSRMYLRTKAMSTGPAAPLITVSGDIAQRVNLNSGVCALGPGSSSYANSVIGRAVRLCMMNVGHTYPGITDMDTIGTPAKYSLCLAETDDIPEEWRASVANADSVTVQFVYGLCDLFDFQSYDAESLIEVFSTALSNTALASAGMWMMGTRADPRYGTEEQEHDVVILAPEHAHIFAKEGWSRADVSAALFKRVRVPFRVAMRNKEPKSILASNPELAWLFDSPDTLVPLVRSADCYDILVAGGAAGRSTVMWGMGGPVTKEIKDTEA